MLLPLLNQLIDNPALFPVVLATFLVTAFLGLIVALTVHEFSHAAVATALGDETPRRAGRLSLNPLRHLDPVGSLLLVIAGFGWGRPVQIDPYSLRRAPSPRGGMAMVAAAGPISNLVTATLLALPVRFGLLAWHPPGAYGAGFILRDPEMILADVISGLILLNVFLGVFNLIPIAPLDGFNLVLGIAPPNLAATLARLQPMGMGILMAVVMVDIFFRLGIVSSFLTPIANATTTFLIGRPVRL